MKNNNKIVLYILNKHSITLINRKTAIKWSISLKSGPKLILNKPIFEESTIQNLNNEPNRFCLIYKLPFLDEK